MAERTPPGFTIPLGFYDGPEVRSIPRRIRAAAIGVWAMAGNYSATRLSDGYVDAETLKDLGCGPAIRVALMNTLGQGGKPDPLWIEAPAGGIQFTKWEKWQRSRAEVTAYRESEAERKRAARAAKKQNRSASTNEVLPECNPSTTALQPDSSQTVIDAESPGPAETEKRPADVRRTSGQSESESETETYRGYVSESATDSNGAGGIAATPGAELVRELIPREHPEAVRTMLRIRASELIRQGHSRADVAAALELWLTKPTLGPNALPSLLSEVLKARAAPAGADRPPNKLRAFAELAAEERALEQAQADRKELM